MIVPTTIKIQCRNHGEFQSPSIVIDQDSYRVLFRKELAFTFAHFTSALGKHLLYG